MAMVTKKSKKEKAEKQPKGQRPSDLITEAELENIRKSLIESHSSVVVKGLMNKHAREELSGIVRRTFKQIHKGDTAVIDYIVRETIGTGIIEEILQDKSVTDIGYNGKHLIIETNDKKMKYDPHTTKVNENYIVRLISKFANANDKEFTAKNPIFDGKFENVRINAVHAQNTVPESGTTMSLRVVYPRLALTKKNFDGFAPMFIYDFLETAMLAKANTVIGGITGTGKTELHKLMVSFIPFEDRVGLIEDVAETFMKEMFPDKDIYSWLVSDAITVTDLVKAALRNHIVWLMVTETRGAEAYEMIQAVKSGHSIVTSLHAISAKAIPKRLVHMSKMGYQFDDESLLEDIREDFDFGLHIKKTRYNGKIVRYLSEIVEFSPEGDRTIFKQRLIDGVFHYETGSVSDKYKERLEDASLKLDLPENLRGMQRPLDKDYGTYETIIPLDESGRPDLAKIEEMGTTLEDLINDNFTPEPEPEPEKPKQQGFVLSDEMLQGAGGNIVVIRQPEHEPEPEGPTEEELEAQRLEEERREREEAARKLEEMKRREHEEAERKRKERLRQLRETSQTKTDTPPTLSKEEKLAKMKADARKRNRS